MKEFYKVGIHKSFWILIIFGALFSTAPAFACSCKAQSFELAYESSAQIYLAEVTESRVDSAGRLGNFLMEESTTKFQVIKKWKGDKDSFEVTSKLGPPGTCEKSFGFKTGEQYYFFLSGDETSYPLSYSLNMCNLVFRSDRNSPYIKGLLSK